MLKDLTVTGFIEELASDSPAPGGGSVAALGAAQTAALFAMVCSLTVGNKKYEDAKEEMSGYIPELKEYEKFFIDAIDNDANSFNGVIAAFKLPKETDEEKAIRKETIQKEYKNAANVPLSTGMKAMELLKYAEPLILRGNQSAITDVGALPCSACPSSILFLMIISNSTGAVRGFSKSSTPFPPARCPKAYNRRWVRMQPL